MKEIKIILIFICSITFPMLIVSQDLQDSIDLELLKIDINDLTSGYYKEMNLPMSFGAFGVKEYSGSGGAIEIDFKLNEKHFIGASFSIGKSKRAEHFFTFNSSHNVFCNIIILTDFYDDKDFTHTSNLISSRNHPNYIGIGTTKTNNQKIDYISFIDISKETINAYVVISGKLFNLSDGNSILVIPQKNLSLQFFQFHFEEFNFMDINAELKEEITKESYSNYIYSKTSIGQ